jgi:hypothetical protein
MVTATMVTALDVKLPSHRNQIVNPPIARIVSHGIEQLGPFIHGNDSISFDTIQPLKFEGGCSGNRRQSAESRLY